MPRGYRKRVNDSVESKKQLCKRNAKCTEVTLNETVANESNVNANHIASTSSDDSDVRLVTKRNRKDAETNHALKVKSKVVVPEKIHVIQFHKDGEDIQMEISDGGAAEAEFASEENSPSKNNDNSDSESDMETDIEMQFEDEENESGEILSTTDHENNNEDREGMQRNKRTKKPRRESIEQQLALMSSTLMAMQEIMMKSGLADKIPKTAEAEEVTGKDKFGKAKKGIKGISNVSSSETTIYKNVLEKKNDIPNEIVRVDSEIDFCIKDRSGSLKHNQNHESSSSEEDRGDTSDELIDYELNNTNVDKFIADCESEAN